MLGQSFMFLTYLPPIRTQSKAVRNTLKKSAISVNHTDKQTDPAKGDRAKYMRHVLW